MALFMQSCAILVLGLQASIVLAQSNLGELLDAGATRITADEFGRELVGRPIAGPGASRNTLEMIYLDGGQLVDTGANTMMGGGFSPNVQYHVKGSWSADADRVCTSMSIEKVVLPARCQFWYRHGPDYSSPIPTPIAARAYFAAR